MPRAEPSRASHACTLKKKIVCFNLVGTAVAGYKVIHLIHRCRPRNDKVVRVSLVASYKGNSTPLLFLQLCSVSCQLSAYTNYRHYSKRIINDKNTDSLPCGKVVNVCLTCYVFWKGLSLLNLLKMGVMYNHFGHVIL